MQPIKSIVPSNDKSKTSTQLVLQLSEDELDVLLADRMAKTQALKKSVLLTDPEADLHMEKWAEYIRQFGIEAFDRALNQCIDESPFWPDPADIRRRIVESAASDAVDGEQSDNNESYWREFRKDQERITAWKNSPEYEQDMTELRAEAQRLDAEREERMRKRAVLESAKLGERAKLIPTMPPDQERAFIQQHVDRYQAKQVGAQ